MRILLLLVFFSISLVANVGSIVNYVGDVEVLRNQSTINVNHKNYELLENDIILTKNNAKVQIRFIDNTTLTLGKNSTLQINKYLINGANSKVNLKAKKGSYDLVSGEISKLARQNFTFQANTATIGIRGTRFSGDVNNGFVDCVSGEIEVGVGGKKYNLKKGERLHYKNLGIIKLEKLKPSSFNVIKL
ncbi:FecR domain-containing protein [Campylobacter sp. RM9334]|uniref:FecR family protein n=1 Tax=Campylobacter sp. RM9334 TaxID=2735732 RepID=UPI001D6A49E9|nr:FecR domain-containing protein [Campylobacter sp. RM9334]